VFLAFQELPAYLDLTVERAQRENEGRLVPRGIWAPRVKLVPRSFLTGNNVFGKGVITGTLD